MRISSLAVPCLLAFSAALTHAQEPPDDPPAVPVIIKKPEADILVRPTGDKLNDGGKIKGDDLPAIHPPTHVEITIKVPGNPIDMHKTRPLNPDPDTGSNDVVFETDPPFEGVPVGDVTIEVKPVRIPAGGGAPIEVSKPTVKKLKIVRSIPEPQ